MISERPTPPHLVSRLGIILDSSGARTDENRVAVNHAVGRLIEAIATMVPNCRLCLPILPERLPEHSHVLDLDPDKTTALPPLGSMIEAQKYYFPTRRILKQFARDVDLLFIRLPFPLMTALRKLPPPKLLQVINNPRAIVAVSTDYRGVVGYAARAFARYVESTMKKLVAEPLTRVATNGQELWNLLKCRTGRVVVSSCLGERDMRPRDDLRLHDPPRLLFVGYLRPEKGVLTLLDAFDRLRATRPLKLTLVGDSDRVTSTGPLMHDRLQASPFRNDISLTGMVDFGPQLFDIYRSHDLYVLPSFSEGTPRTLIEARGFGCPVVASRVGGIPSSVTDGSDGLLFTAGNSAELAATVSRVLDDDTLRRGLIAVGLETARKHSLENFAAELVGELCELERQFVTPVRRPVACAM